MRRNELFMGQRVTGWTALRGNVKGKVVGWSGSPTRVDIKIEHDMVPSVSTVRPRGGIPYHPKTIKAGTVIDVGIINVEPIDAKPVPEKTARKATAVKKKAEPVQRAEIKACRVGDEACTAPVVRKKQKSKALAGEIVYVTGKVEGCSKEQMEALVIANGGTWKDFGRQTTLLVIGNKKEGLSKLDKAERWGTRTMGVGEFFDMIGFSGAC